MQVGVTEVEAINRDGSSPSDGGLKIIQVEYRKLVSTGNYSNESYGATAETDHLHEHVQARAVTAVERSLDGVKLEVIKG